MKITTGLIITLVVGFLGLVAGLVIIIVTGHDAALYGTNIGILVTAVTGFAFLFRNQAQQGDAINVIGKNTNGTLTALRAENAAKDAQLKSALALLPPDHAQSVLDQTISKDEVAQVVASVTPAPIKPPVVD